VWPAGRGMPEGSEQLANQVRSTRRRDVDVRR